MKAVETVLYRCGRALGIVGLVFLLVGRAAQSDLTALIGCAFLTAMALGNIRLADSPKLPRFRRPWLSKAILWLSGGVLVLWLLLVWMKAPWAWQ